MMSEVKIKMKEAETPNKQKVDINKKWQKQKLWHRQLCW